MVVLDTPQMTGRPAQMMGFMDAVKNVLLNNYVNFDGRASRSEYWWWVLATIPMSFPFFILDVTVFGWGIEDPTWFQNMPEYQNSASDRSSSLFQEFKSQLG